ncbi:RagB/SusD family nutrient uptake outer membrane protein [Muribaculum intestinale]|uniref:RagB/SusD family nutrient uptake outer membrane protein n=1 Tax=Muribaculum intestinale TaxID=1796646 RepID=UPI0024201C04|nr:RagB/SusD family nutrient uptake outer membrane protein [Muribaculum intestinale]
MKLRHITIAGCMLCGAALTSCGDSFFEQYPANEITEGNFYQSDDDFNQGVRSCYAKLKTESGYYITELGYRSDESTLLAMATSTQDRYDIDHFQDVASNGICADIWKAWYNGIYRCNDVLDHMTGKESLPNYRQYRGEALFIRSWFYFNLYRAFGVVPIARNVVNPEAAKSIPRCSEQEMYNLLVSDLTEAASLLPAKAGAEKARVTDIAAWTLLAKVQLTFKRHAEARASLDEAIKNTSYGLMDNPADVFDVNKKFNKELIFVLHYEKTNGEGHGHWYSQKSNVLSEINSPSPELRALYSTDDLRRPLIWEYIKQGSLYVLKKWYDEYDATYTSHVGNDFPFLRYADITLMYAEALAETSVSDALVWLNKTRTRAGLSELTIAEVSTRDQFIRALADERGREFALEGHRWFDLVRLGLAIETMRAAGFTLDEHNLIFPIPQNQIEIVNNASILWQNPGYNS